MQFYDHIKIKNTIKTEHFHASLTLYKQILRELKIIQIFTLIKQATAKNIRQTSKQSNSLAFSGSLIGFCFGYLVLVKVPSFHLIR